MAAADGAERSGSRTCTQVLNQYSVSLPWDRRHLIRIISPKLIMFREYVGDGSANFEKFEKAIIHDVGFKGLAHFRFLPMGKR